MEFCDGCKENGCHLKSLVNSQSKRGGRKSIDISSMRAGKYWTRSGWDRFINSVNDLKTECKDSETLLKLTARITNEKNRNNELIDI